jgi:hypothetical protein
MTYAGIVLHSIAYVHEVQISQCMNLEFRGASLLLDNCLVKISKEAESGFGFCLTACNLVSLIEDTVALYKCMYVCMCVYVRMYVRVCMYVCINVYLHIQV